SKPSDAWLGPSVRRACRSETSRRAPPGLGTVEGTGSTTVVAIFDENATFHLSAHYPALRMQISCSESGLNPALNGSFRDKMADMKTAQAWVLGMAAMLVAFAPAITQAQGG